MSKITRITVQKKHKHRYNIFLDRNGSEEYGFSVSEEVLIESTLRKGIVLDEAAIEALIKQDTLQKSYAQAINYLSYRMRSKKEMRDYLLKKEVDDEHITQIMDKLIRDNLINDQLFADSFVRTRIQMSNKGPRFVKKELQEKGVTAMIAEQACTQYTYQVQYEKIQKWIAKKINQNGKDSFRKQVQSLQSTLMQKGFQQQVITDALQEIKEEKNDHAEWEAVVHQGEKLLRKYLSKYTGFELKQKLKEALYRKGFAMDDINQFIDEHTE